MEHLENRLVTPSSDFKLCYNQFFGDVVYCTQ